jgi:ferric-dicitrate binding protein FerR (iron transport regulator)
MEKDRLWLLMARKLAGESSTEELRELSELLRKHPDIHFPLQTLTDIWAAENAASNNTEAEAAYANHKKRLDDIYHQPEQSPFLLEGRRRNLKPILVFLTSVVIVAGIAWLAGIGKSRPAAKKPVSEISTKYGSKTNIHLPDGSEVWLNSGTRITYDESFGRDTREIRLTGEAFFNVVKDPSKPFIIHTSDMDLKVLGTSFNVKAYPGERSSEASLIHGSLEVSIRARNSEKIILHPNEKIIVTSNTIIKDDKKQEQSGKEPIVAIKELTQYEPVDSIIVETSWVDNKLVFQDESFKEIALKMERWYGTTIGFTDPSVERLRFTGIFEKESLQQALHAMSITAPFSYKVTTNGIIISK